ncbi:MAG: HAMP domain-containing sensor histidine kinase [Bacteroidota bacterium]
MILYTQKLLWKRMLLIIAVCIGLFSLWYTNKLVQKLAHEEEKKVLLWANATKALLKSEGDFNFLLDIIKDNETIPTILVDDKGKYISSRNLDSVKSNDEKYIAEQLQIMMAQHEPIKILYDEKNQHYNYLYYKNSIILTQLKRYPYYQLSIIAIFILISYFAFSASRKAEQNQVWVGMSKETAHQLGTPISSLNAWINLIRETEKIDQEELLVELENDVKRLERITERFSKIGSAPDLKSENVGEVLSNSIAYLKPRVSEKVVLELINEDPETTALMNIPLFEWVIENLCKNAIDAMTGEGKITMNIISEAEKVTIDISDTGKGMSPSKFKTVFKPGFTTKKRGWGLGLSLAKRIIEEYHNGKIFVKESTPDKGTTFRIELNA